MQDTEAVVEADLGEWQQARQRVNLKLAYTSFNVAPPHTHIHIHTQKQSNRKATGAYLPGARLHVFFFPDIECDSFSLVTHVTRWCRDHVVDPGICA